MTHDELLSDLRWANQNHQNDQRLSSERIETLERELKQSNALVANLKAALAAASLPRGDAANAPAAVDPVKVSLSSTCTSDLTLPLWPRVNWAPYGANWSYHQTHISVLGTRPNASNDIGNFLSASRTVQENSQVACATLPEVAMPRHRRCDVRAQFWLVRAPKNKTNNTHL